MNNKFIAPVDALPKWMSSLPNVGVQSSGQLFHGADSGRSRDAVANFGDGGPGDVSSISKQSTFFPAHVNQSGFENVKFHGGQSPITVSLTEIGSSGNLKNNQIWFDSGVSICKMQISNPSKAVLAENLNRLMSATWSLNSNTKLAKRSRLGLGTMGRVRNAEAAATIDTLDTLADCFGLQPWELLMPHNAVTQPLALELPETLAAPAQTDFHAIKTSSTAQELGVLFDLLTGRNGKVDKAEVFTAALEAISRAVTGRHEQPTDEPAPAELAKKPLV